MKISVVTPTVRPELLPVVEKCLARQTEQDYEWLVGSPKDYGFGEWIPEPPKKQGDYYNLNKAMNALYKASKGQIIVEITDGIWFPPDTLEKLYAHFEANPKACITTIGHQYDQEANGKPEHLVWRDPRARMDQGSFYEIFPNDFEMCLASIPRQAIIDCNGLKEKWDQFCALSEKEMCARMDKLGYKFFLDQSLEYRAIKHERFGGSTAWDEGYKKGCIYYQECIDKINKGEELKGDLCLKDTTLEQKNTKEK